MLYHHSRDALYRTPHGAVPCGAEVIIRIRVAPTPLRVTFRAWWDGREERLPMYACAPELYEIIYPMPEHTGNLWYHFIVEQNGETLYYGNAPDELGGEGAAYTFEPPGYQITVYDPAYQVPAWMREGILYQVMVDRFCASKPPSERHVGDGNILHMDWYEPPLLRMKNGDNAANDFFGGDLMGLREKLPYLASLGVSVLYLNPIFEAHSNHKYDTGDYMKVDPAFGTEEDLRVLCEDARALGIRVLLDGVFSHTGSDSRYFNRYGRYDSVGAYQSPASPYASWYMFERWPDVYDCWWGFDTLPNVREMDEKYLDFIIRGEDAVVPHWFRAGISGWRLDVADELPMDFLRLFKKRIKELSRENALIGEVWEDASNKIAYGEQRNYCLGDTLDSCMNYPLRDALIDFLTEKFDALSFVRRIETMAEKYPKPFFYSLMNMLGSHDKPRIINILADAGEMEPPRAERHAMTLTDEAYNLGCMRFLAAWRFIASMPGMPSLYYGDEAGAEGMSDPFCRGTYPWGRENMTLLSEIMQINRVRASSDVLKTGEMRLYAPSKDVAVCVRRIAGGRDVFGEERENGLIFCALNRARAPVDVRLPKDGFLPGDVEISIPLVSSVWGEMGVSASEEWKLVTRMPDAHVRMPYARTIEGAE